MRSFEIVERTGCSSHYVFVVIRAYTMHKRLVILAGFVCTLGFSNVSIAQQQPDDAVASGTVSQTPQVAALTNQFHVLDAQVVNPVEFAPPGTIEDNSADLDDRTATDAPRRLQSAIR